MISLSTILRALTLRVKLLPVRLRNLVPPIPLPMGGIWLFGVPFKRAFTRYEVDASAFLRQRIKPGDTFVDIGANLGYYTILAAKLGARVVAYEPDTKAFGLLKKNIRLHRLSNVESHNVAVSDTVGESRFYVKAPGASVNSLLPVFDGHTISVHTVTCDISYDICKIDVEGAELQVLKGLKHKGVILAEIAPAVLRALGVAEEDYLSRLRQAGYHVSALGNKVSTDADIIAQAKAHGHAELLLTPV